MKVTEHSIILDNGTVWPNPNRDPDDMTPEQARYYLNSVHQAYWHLLSHPIGTEATVKTLRELRKALRTPTLQDLA
jgi:hypothetical protein